MGKQHLRGMVVAFCLLLAGCSEVRLYSNLPEREVNEMVAILQKSGISASKLEGDEGQWHITVVKEKYADAVAILSQVGRPKKQRPTIEELFPKSGFTSSPSEQRIRLTYGLEQSLESTITALPGGVIDARVHLVLPENQPLRGSVKPSRANVLVIHRKGSDIQHAVATIPQIVMGAVDGLDADSIGVKLVEAAESPLTTPVPAAATPEIDLVDVLSIQLTRESLPRFFALLGIVGLLFLFTVGAMLLRLIRSRRVAG